MSLRASPVLLGVAHGSRDPRAAVTIRRLLAAAVSARPGLVARAAFLENAEPSLPDALGELAGTAEVVVVPLLLSAAYHSDRDLPAQLEAALGMLPPAARPVVSVTPVLGPDLRLIDAVERRLAAAGVRERTQWRLVLGAAGSSTPSAQADVAAAAAELGRRGWAAVSHGYASAAAPRLKQAVTQARLAAAKGERVAVASFLLAPGRFSDEQLTVGADAVSEPLGDAPEIVEVLLDRYDTAAAGNPDPCLEPRAVAAVASTAAVSAPGSR
ncbi:MAG: sirohydrochlorin chelatase [Actinomycetes bacterium]